MEDRYLFKAKRVDDGDWIVGGLVRYGFTGKEKYYIVPDYASDLYAIEIDPTTICQYTGLKDKNGKLIWENDIVKINNSKANVLITFRDFEIICTIPSEKYYKHRLEYDTEYEVIGNIFDNPELLESEG
nr:MAG TPA: YopX protein [Caudoviricetes sp.]